MNRMACIPTRDTRPERLLIAAARRIFDGRMMTQVVGLPATPDVLLPERKIVLLGQGCFWHNHQGDRCPIAHVPVTRFDWAGKFSNTRQRDARNRADLIAAGYRVAWVWECSLVGASAVPEAELDARLVAFIRGREPFLEIEGEELATAGVAA